MSQDRESHNSFEKSATFFLEAANQALLNEQPRLAIYLFRAAFEVESSFTTTASSQVIEGLRKAWDLACELGDRSTAESIHGELGTFNSHEQNEQALIRLQALAMTQLEDMGISEHDLENIAGALEHEFMGPVNDDLFDALKSMLEQLMVPPQNELEENNPATQAARLSLPESAGADLEGDDQSEMPDTFGETVADSASDTGAEIISLQQTGLAKLGRQLREFRNRKNEAAPAQRFNYETLTGFKRAMEHMREFGFLTEADGHQREFVQRAAIMHGVPRLSLNDTFLFTGSSREDVSLFAHATAGEIGFPLITVLVELDSLGNGTIKLSGPFRRAFYGGPPDIMDMATPCTVLIENIDYLQHMFHNEQMAAQRNSSRPRGMMPGMGRSMQVEIGGYLRALRQKPGMVMIATARDTVMVNEVLYSLLGPLRRIDIFPPDSDERLEVLHTFASEHPSFAELDIKQVVRYSEGISRNTLVQAAHSVVEQAYQKSLRTRTYNRVTLGDVLIKLASLVDHESPIYRNIEDEAVAEFLYNLEYDDML